MRATGGRVSDTAARSRSRAATARLAAAALLACTVLAAPPAARAASSAAELSSEAQPVAPRPPPPPPVIHRLSNEQTVTAWAHPIETGPIFARPSFHSQHVGALHLETEDGFAEVYMVLSSFERPRNGEEWLRIRIPARPNGQIGWIPRERLGTLQYSRWQLVIELGRHQLKAYDEGRLIRTLPVGVGKPSTPTPAGHFWIRERFRVSDHSNPYWPYALGTSDYSTLTTWPGGGVVGIHGPYGEEQKIPGDPSHGCVRMRVADIAWLGPRVPLGTPVDIVTS